LDLKKLDLFVVIVKLTSVHKKIDHI